MGNEKERRRSNGVSREKEKERKKERRTRLICKQKSCCEKVGQVGLCGWLWSKFSSCSFFYSFLLVQPSTTSNRERRAGGGCRVILCVFECSGCRSRGIISGIILVKVVIERGPGFSGAVVESRPSGVDYRLSGVEVLHGVLGFLPVALGILSSIAPLRSFHLPHCSSWATIGAGVTQRANLDLTSPFLSHLFALDETKASRRAEPCE